MAVMRGRTLLVAGLMLGAAAGMPGWSPRAARANHTASPGTDHAAPVITGATFTGNFPDPFVLRSGSTYYAYGTKTGGRNIPILRSTDLRTWTGAGEALPSVPTWSANRDLWAPGAVAVGDRIVLFYTAPEVSSGRQCITYGVSAPGALPTGPFVDGSSGPLICQRDLNGSIDPSPFVDRDGTSYLVWKSEGRTDGEETKIWSQRFALNGSVVSLQGPVAQILTRDQEWERPLVENPSLVFAGGRYLLFWSSGLWDTPGYAIGYAVCDGPQGPCRKPLNRPLVTSFAGTAGPGGPSAFVDANGALQLAFHAWTPPAVGYDKVGSARTLRVHRIDIGADGSLTVAGAGESSATVAVSALRSTTTDGLWMFGTAGDARAYGAASFFGSMAGQALAQPIVGAASTASGRGYWLLGRDGGVFSFGDALFFGSTGDIRLNQPVVGIAATPSGRGYWFVAADGGVFSYGDASFFGSTGDIRLNQPIVGMAASPTGRGYWLVARDGGVFAFGDAVFFGSTGDIRLNQPIVGMAASPTGRGYWFVAADGGVFSFGDGRFFGSGSGQVSAKSPVVGMAASRNGTGYWLVTRDGRALPFGTAPSLA